MPTPYPHAVERFPRLRQSDLSDFDNCALTSHFALTFEKGWSSHPAGRGQIVHRTLARCIEEMEDNDSDWIDVGVALDFFEEELRQHRARLVAEAGNEGDTVVAIPLRQVAEARVSVKTWAAYHGLKIAELAGVERRYDSAVAYPDENGEAVERVITGRPDVVLIDDSGENAVVVDWKDTWAIPSEGARGRAEFDEDDPGYLPDTDISQEGYFQQRFYALLIFHHYPRVQRVTLREFYVRYASGKAVDRATGKPINPTREATVDRHVLPEIEAEMRALVERFDRAQEAYLTTRRRGRERPERYEARRSRVFTPSPGSHCNYCVRKNRCPILPEARVEGQITSQEHAELIAGRVQVVRGYLRSATAALRQWSNWYGDVSVKDAKRPRVYGPVTRIEQHKPTQREAAEAQRRGIPVERLYERREVVKFAIHSPAEVHPFAAQAREEEEMLLAAERAEAER